MNEEIWKIPFSLVKNDWNLLQRYLEFKGNPRYIIVEDVNLTFRKDISDLGNLVGVVGDLKLAWLSIESLGDLQFVNGDLVLWDCKNIKTLGKLKKVGGNLILSESSIESLGELEYIGGDLLIYETKIPQSEIDKVNVVGKIYR